MDNKFSLKNSQFDLLAPLYDSKTGLWFTQGSLHRTDDRTQTNLGMGYRWFHDTWMLGGNAFWDNDWSHNHTRGGVGMEYWRDFLKVSANDYFRLSGWKDSPDVVDYQERPADGWDVRLQGWVPALPQLGGKLTYEQYYGNEVALFGKDNRQSNPRAITAGVTYTPVPLMTLSAEQRQGESGANDTRFGVEMNYQLGVPWRQQLDPAGVAALRTLVGSRYDLVERNNNIVLEYRKKEVIRLHMANLVTGYSGESKSLGVSVNSKYGLSHIDWTAPPQLHIVPTGNGDYSVTLPAWNSAAGAVNTYTISGVAVDTKGNHSERSQTQVMVMKSNISQRYSSLTPLTSILPADGKTQETLMLKVKNANGNLVDVAVSDIKINTQLKSVQQGGHLQRAKDITVSDPVKSNTVGLYVMTVTAGTSEETAIISSTVEDVAVKPATVSVSSVVPVAESSTIKLNHATYTVGDKMQVTVTLKDAHGKVVTGASSLLTANTVTVENATLKPCNDWKYNDNGTYTATYMAGRRGSDLKATLKLNGWSNSVKSDAYAIMEAPMLKDVTVNGYTFTKDAGFPTTGFKGATFTLNLTFGLASDYSWSSDASWVSVADGVVKFTGKGTGEKVTIVGSPKRSEGKPIKYSFMLKSWYIPGKKSIFWPEASAYCKSLSGYSLPTIVQLTNNTWREPGARDDQHRAVKAGLWSEWGHMKNYSDADFSGALYWTSEKRRLGHHYNVGLSSGGVLDYSDYTPLNTVCRQEF